MRLRQGAAAPAQEHLEEALSLLRETYGDAAHVSVATCWLMLGHVAKAQGDPTAAVAPPPASHETRVQAEAGEK